MGAEWGHCVKRRGLEGGVDFVARCLKGTLAVWYLPAGKLPALLLPYEKHAQLRGGCRKPLSPLMLFHTPQPHPSTPTRPLPRFFPAYIRTQLRDGRLKPSAAFVDEVLFAPGVNQETTFVVLSS